MAKTIELPSIDRRVDLSAITEFAEEAGRLSEELREMMLAPRPRKMAPTFTSAQVAEMCGIDRIKLNNLLATREGLPQGVAQGSGRSRVFTLPEARTWVQQVSDIYQTPLHTGVRDADGKVILVANFKGGSTKTTTTMCLAQGLTLRGRKVLLIDLDPQASLTELCGLYAEKEVTEDSTVLPFIYDPHMEGGLLNFVQETYWDGLDVIPAHPTLFSAEFHIPGTVIKNPGFKFWDLLRQGVEALRKQYDYIILDTAPSLSYLTINALMAADAMVMPLVPESLDFISSVSFWSLFSDLAHTIMERGDEKTYDFVSVLLSKVDYGKTSSAPVVRSWVQRTYKDWVNALEVPASSAMSNGALAMATVFDISKGDLADKTVARVRQPLTDYVQWIDDLYVEQWRAGK
ncbi:MULTISPECIES: AAA family ATPase [Paraburkholderia]|uniref:Chromosome partitioning protein n=1 Tax=Paraburkholderia silvatlantica TaxID=321895 RepID=A0A2U1AIC8_9BURK|nr:MULTISPECIES: AAA family ATPase [Paraburkholderia]MBB2927428.1 chromosome partitioning protein [Paraburkholderia silvatlantica]PVY36143.1 chromosome partitioning protein [Paraburkholderia silvatlantica]PXW40441.1 chromosome partitioning protein [Paraburkholderia silvatlantica]PYE24409.1 chromosome partitioning protein [Paraburkholderia silvatlantica]TDQ97606.1 chromosome partitioning protein [Paraburkholderia silvatlantica]